MSLADRGKAAEKAVQAYLQEVSAKNARFDFERLPDARAAMGRFKAMIGDFEFFSPGQHGVIEVKETKHSYRISKGKLEQLPRLHKRAMCGGLCLVVVHFSELKRWRAVQAINLPIGKASWDLSLYPLFDSAAEAIQQYDLTGEQR